MMTQSGQRVRLESLEEPKEGSERASWGPMAAESEGQVCCDGWSFSKNKFSGGQCLLKVSLVGIRFP